jgi:hypothetical protein
MLPLFWGKHVSPNIADRPPRKTRKHGTYNWSITIGKTRSVQWGGRPLYNWDCKSAPRGARRMIAPGPAPFT